ncbi:MAG: hypothetical protein NWS47_01335 [Alphaproteobacteria bacterium]|nr:hypothetical protein [Alphaproteobacteria bacterium]
MHNKLLFTIIFAFSIFVYAPLEANTDFVGEINALHRQYDVLVNPPIVQKWGMRKLKGIECVQRVADTAKPRLPAGFIWSIDELGSLQILKHQCVEAVNFNIYVFGPDEYDRIQFVVSEEGVPTHGFAMTRMGTEFPETLRNTYPMLTDDYKKGTITKCRGHIIDYKDTLGSARDVAISTLCVFNYKPEPWGYWARTLRTQMVAELRRHQSSYAEYMFYPFNLAKTNNKTPIPTEVLFEESPMNPNIAQSYLVSEAHACHAWEARNVSMYQAKSILRTTKKVRPFIWNRQLNSVKQRASLDGFFRSQAAPVIDFCDLYLLMVAAETEYSGATLKMTYLSWAAGSGAPLSIIKLWLNRSVLTAQYIDDTYHSVVPAFPATVLNTIKTALTERDALGDGSIQV